MTIGKLYISHKNYNFLELPAIPVNKKNVDKIIKDTKQYNCWTSPEDLFFENFKKVIDASEEIELLDIDEKFFLNLSDIKFADYARILSLLTKSNKKIKNFDWTKNINIEQFSILDKSRVSKNKTLWAFGCSFTEGLGVEKHQRYADILSQHYIDYDYINAGRSGSSHWYHANRILQSDIRKDDIVIWNLTTVARIEFIEHDCFLDSTAIGSMANIDKSQHFWNANYFESKVIYMSTLNLIMSVINYCKKMQAKLVLVNMLEMNLIPLVLKDLDIVIDLIKLDENNQFEFIDKGSDGSHPGPLQHLEYATKLHNFIQKRYFANE